MAAGIYQTTAVPLKGSHWRETSLAMLVTAIEGGEQATSLKDVCCGSGCNALWRWAEEATGHRGGGGKDRRELQHEASARVGSGDVELPDLDAPRGPGGPPGTAGGGVAHHGATLAPEYVEATLETTLSMSRAPSFLEKTFSIDKRRGSRSLHAPPLSDGGSTARAQLRSVSFSTSDAVLAEEGLQHPRTSLGALPWASGFASTKDCDDGLPAEVTPEGVSRGGI